MGINCMMGSFSVEKDWRDSNAADLPISTYNTANAFIMSLWYNSIFNNCLQLLWNAIDTIIMILCSDFACGAFISVVDIRNHIGRIERMEGRTWRAS
jgi:hypothetical protein